MSTNTATTVTGNGDWSIGVGHNTETSILYVGDTFGATVQLGYVDTYGDWVDLQNGELQANSQYPVNHGHGMALKVRVSGYVDEFEILVKKQGANAAYPDGGIVGGMSVLLQQIADNTASPIKVDAPLDGRRYLRQNALWTSLEEYLSTITVKQEVIGAFFTTDTQTPTGEGAGNSIMVYFGAGGSTADGEFTVASDGMIECFKNSIEYGFSVTVRLQREGGGGIAYVVARMMYAEDGVNFQQAGTTFGVKIDDAATVWRETFDIKFSPAVGSKLYFEFARDETSSNAGEIGTFQPTGTLQDWVPIPSAQLEISKHVVNQP